MSRDELLETNTNIVSSVVRETVKRSPDAILIIVSNPLDVMTHVASRVSGFPRGHLSVYYYHWGACWVDDLGQIPLEFGLLVSMGFLRVSLGTMCVRLQRG